MLKSRSDSQMILHVKDVLSEKHPDAAPRTLCRECLDDTAQKPPVHPILFDKLMVFLFVKYGFAVIWDPSNMQVIWS